MIYIDFFLMLVEINFLHFKYKNLLIFLSQIDNLFFNFSSCCRVPHDSHFKHTGNILSYDQIFANDEDQTPVYLVNK